MREYLAAVAHAAPTAHVEQVTDFELRVTMPGNLSNHVYLNNCYAEWQRSSQSDRAEVINRYLAALATTSENTTPQRARIIPVVKDKAWLNEMAETLRQSGMTKRMEFVTDDINDELCIVYAEDSEKQISYLTPARLQECGIPRANLKRTAINNLRSVLPKISVRGNDGYYVLLAGGTYEACLILLDEIWNHPSFKVDGEIVVAIPSRDLLLITGTHNTAAITKMKAVATAAAANASYRLTTDLFVYRNGRFVRYQ